MEKIYLDRNENLYGPAPACYDVLRKANLEQLSLYARDYTRGRKSELSHRLGGEIGIPEDRVLLSYGSEDMLKQVVHCYLKQGETILLPRQSWWYYKAVADDVSGKAVEYPLHEHNGRFEYDVDEITDMYKLHRPHVILIASPNNPTGNSISLDDLTEVITHCQSSVIVLDEAYFGFTNESHKHLKGMLDSHSRLVVLRTFSKYFALAGLRIGYACISEDMKRLASFSARYLGYNQLTEKIALAALDEREYYQRIARQMRGDKANFYKLFSTCVGFTAFHSDANFILVRYPLTRKKELQTGLLEQGIIVKFLDDPGLEDCMRITIGTKEQNAYVACAIRETIAGQSAAANVPAYSHQK
jgi:histidinol-phosphate aminotransferase